MFVAPWIAKSCGYNLEGGPKLYDMVRVKLQDPVRGSYNKITLRRILISTVDDELICSTPVHQGSGNLRSMVICNGMTLLPKGVDGKVGDIIDALWFR